MKNHIYRFILLCAAATVAFPSTVAAQSKKSTVLDVKTSISDNNIVYPESFEANTRKMLEGWYMKNYMATDDRYRREGDTSKQSFIPLLLCLPINSRINET